MSNTNLQNHNMYTDLAPLFGLPPNDTRINLFLHYVVDIKETRGVERLLKHGNGAHPSLWDKKPDFDGGLAAAVNKKITEILGTNNMTYQELDTKLTTYKDKYIDSSTAARPKTKAITFTQLDDYVTFFTVMAVDELIANPIYLYKDTPYNCRYSGSALK